MYSQESHVVLTEFECLDMQFFNRLAMADVGGSADSVNGGIVWQL